jgi:lincosamide and streptogramin A transport system ATP-binding/permease protein
MSFAYDGSSETIFENVTLNLDSSWKLGLVGRNGRGKSTFLKLLSGELETNAGSISFSNKTVRFPFEIADESIYVLNVIKESVGGFYTKECEMKRLTEVDDDASRMAYADLTNDYYEQGGYELEAKIAKELSSMNLDSTILDRIYAGLSGGEKTKIRIISMFLQDDNFLLIDEPTNHLDIYARVELSEYLKSKTGYILVSHDQEFLETTVDHILSINKKSITVSKCKFNEWLENKENHEKNEMMRKGEYQKEIKKLEGSSVRMRSWAGHREITKRAGIDSGYAGKMSAKLMKRAIALEKRKEKRVEEIKGMLADYEIHKTLEIKQDKLLSRKYMSIRNLSFGYTRKKILDNVSFDINQGDRIWIKGGNGVGKTTLLNLIEGKLKPDSGLVKKHQDIRIIHSIQEPHHSDLTVDEYRRNSLSDETIFNTILDYFDMSTDYLSKPLKNLSSGELKKIEIAKSLSNRSEIYLWDEILNFMDIQFRLQMEEAILRYEPTIIFISHDEAFSKKIATKIVEVKAL